MVGKISPEISEKIWKKWLQENDSKTPFNRYDHGLRSVSKHNPSFKKFDEMLFTYGGVVRQENHKRYFEFFSEEDAIAFVLTHA